MLELIIAAAAIGCLDPDPRTAEGRKALLEIGEPCRKPALRPAGPLPDDTRDEIRKYFAAQITRAAKWHWLPPRSAPAIYCGWTHDPSLGGWRPYYVSFSVTGQLRGGAFSAPGRDGLVVRALCTREGYDVSTPPS